MKEKFMRILSPVTIAVVAILDVAVIGYGIFAIKKIMQAPRGPVIFFALCELVALVIAVLVTKETFSNGVKFYDDEMEFVGLDSENIFNYDDILEVRTEKDTAPSFTKNFIDRQSKIILTLKDDKIITIDIGITTKNALAEIEKEIKSRVGIEDNTEDITEADAPMTETPEAETPEADAPVTETPETETPEADASAEDEEKAEE